MLSADEFEATFTTIDKDGDGLITADEITAMLAAMGQPLSNDAASTMLGFIDADGDGKVTRDELKAYLEKA
ncbi:MAG TPA: EF-hand domain-containing protein [Kineosporiaceae bacterium]